MKQKNQEVILEIIVCNRKLKASLTRRRACQPSVLSDREYTEMCWIDRLAPNQPGFTAH